jgi:hypothetical protein
MKSKKTEATINPVIISERQALHLALLEVGAFQTPDGIYLIESFVSESENCVIGLGNHVTRDFNTVIAHLGHLTFRFGKKDLHTAKAHQRVAQGLMEHYQTYLEIKTQKNVVNA